MEIPEKFIKLINVCVRISKYVGPYPLELLDRPDEELEGIIEDAGYYIKNVPSEAREEILGGENIDGLAKKCSKILLDRIKSRAELETLLGK